MRKITAFLLAAIMCVSFAAETGFTANADNGEQPMPVNEQPVNEQPTMPEQPPEEVTPAPVPSATEPPATPPPATEPPVTEPPVTEPPATEPPVTPEPSATPAVEPSPTPAAEPSATPAVEPSTTPTAEPTPSPTPSTSPTPKAANGLCTAVFEDKSGSGFEFALIGKPENLYEAGETLSFGFTDSAKNADKRLYEGYTWYVTMQNPEGGGGVILFVGANEDNSVFTLYSDEARTVTAAVTGSIHVVLMEKTPRKFGVTVSGDTEKLTDIKTVFISADTADADKDYVFCVAHPQYMDPLPEGFVSATAYSLPLIKINDIDFFGYTLKRVNEAKEFGEQKYTQYWEITIPKEYIRGSILIYANKHDIAATKNYVNMWEAVNGLVPYSEDEHMIGSVVADVSDNGKQAYYFYYKSPAPNAPHPLYSINGVLYPLSPMPEYGMISPAKSNVYKIGGITDNVMIELGYNVEKLGSGNNEEVLIELPTETVKAGESCTFKVMTHGMTETQLQIYVSMGGSMLEPDGTVLKKEVFVDETDVQAGYVEYTIPAVTGDVVVQARSAFKVNCRVKLDDAYNTKSALKYKAFDYGKAYMTTMLLNYDPAKRTGEFEYGGTGLSFEIVNAPLYIVNGKANVDGLSPDPNTGCYQYDFTGSTMGGKPVAVTQYGSHYIVNNGKAITGDVVIKTNISWLAQYAYTVNGEEKLISVTNRETFVNGQKILYTGREAQLPTYRYLFTVKADPNLTKKIYLRQFGTASTIKRTYSKATAMLYGDLVMSNIAVTLLGADEVEVYATGQRASCVNFINPATSEYYARKCDFYYGCTAKRGANFTFAVSPAAKIKIITGGKILTEGKEYTTAYDETKGVYLYTVRGTYMTADTEIKATARYTVRYTGAKNAKPQGKNYTSIDYFNAGTDYVFTLSKGSVTIKVGAQKQDDGSFSGGRVLKKGKDYSVADDVYTVFAKSVTDDLLISVSSSNSSKKGGRYNGGGYASKYAGDTELEIGSEIFMTMDGKKTVYLVIVYGEPEDGRSVCFNTDKMIWADSYEAYVWLEISDKEYDEFEEYAVDSVSMMYDREIREKIAAETKESGEKIEIPPFQKIHNINEDYEAICDVNEDGKVDEEDLKLMRRMFNGDFEDFDDIPMRSFILADTDLSSTLDMRDAAVIKNNFDKDDEEQNEEE